MRSTLDIHIGTYIYDVSHREGRGGAHASAARRTPLHSSCESTGWADM
jgi:hypothetical protein